MADSIGIMLVGRNSIVREGLSRILSENDFNVIQSFGAIGELCRKSTGDELVDLILVDPVAWDADVAQVPDVQKRFPNARIVALMDNVDFNGLVTALRAGAHGLILTEVSCETLVESIRLTAFGERILPSALAELMPPYVNDMRWQPADMMRGTKLSSREIEILRCLIMGCPNTLISRRLNISEAAVKVHVKAVLRKIPVKNRTQAAIWAVKQGVTAFDIPKREINNSQHAPAAFVAAARPTHRELLPA